MIEYLMDTGEGRLQVMDQFGIDMQVLSLVTPDVQVFEADEGVRMAKKMNDKLSQIVNDHPTRFAGLACLALQIYLHPRAPSPDMIKPYLDYPFMDSAMLGFAAEASLHAMRLICSGVFDKYPGLKIILGHLGEAIPFWLWRIDKSWEKGPLSETLKTPPSQYFKDNFVVSTSGMFSEPALIYTLSVLSADNILFAIDFPMESPEEAIKFMDESSINHKDKEKIYHLNAERIFSL